jgi:acyl-CoA synthetase (AMP-forming)/AMP-acid ligase II
VEIENRLEAHPDIDEVAVVGVPHPDLGQEVVAVCVLAPGASAGPDDLAAWCAETLAYFKVPSRWELRDERLPRNATGKVLKHVLTDDGGLDFVEED